MSRPKMRLRYSPASPFVRKVMVFAHETGLVDRLELIATDVWSQDLADFHRANPLGKIPTLTTDDGTFIGSALCCEYLDTLHTGRRLIPSEPRSRWPVLQLHAIGDGILEAAVVRVVEVVRKSQEFRYLPNVDRQTGKITRALDSIEAEVRSIGKTPDLATITLACALGYLDFRLPELDWRQGRPATAEWFGPFAARRSMVATQPRLPK
ncbi:MAG TPA: glutathione S-transferase [Stellaceae bacterium]|nr:glutathione S-transferase [Stellaceae bacterium]